MSALTHVDPSGKPTMVDVGAKAVTHRTAVAETRVRFPAAVAAALRDAQFATAKGPVFHTAIVAGVMATLALSASASVVRQAQAELATVGVRASRAPAS